MKRNGHMMYAKHKTANHKTVCCCVCGKQLTPDKAYYYVDGCNFAITNNAKPYCKDCKDKKEGII